MTVSTLPPPPPPPPPPDVLAAGPASPTRTTLLAGARAMVPLALAVTPQGLTLGLILGQLHTPTLATWSTSWLIYSGSSQLAAMTAYAAGSAGIVAIIVTMVINARLLFYGAALAPEWRERPAGWRLLAGYLLIDPSFMLAQERNARPGTAHQKATFYLGGAILLWLWWQLVTGVGILAPALVPHSAALSAAAPLCFVAMLSSEVRGRPKLAAAAAAAIAAVALAGLPWGAGMIVAMVVGISVGMLAGGREQVSP